MGSPTSPLPPAWVALPPALREGIVRALDGLAEGRAEADADSPAGVSGAPVVTLLGCEGDAARVTVRALLSHMIWHAAQSGSDWFDHQFYVCTAVFAGSAVVSEAIVHHRMINVSEYAEQTHYDRAAAVAQVVSELRAAAGRV